MLNENRLEFKANEAELTLGVELELQVLDGQSLLLTPRATDVLTELKDDKQFAPEFFQSTLEIVSGVCHTVHDVERDLSGALQRVKAVSSGMGLKMASTGTHPLGDYRDRLVTPSPRYNELIDRNQWLIRRMAVYGMHIHVGMRSGDACMQYNYFFMHFLPHIMSLSGSSPFWQGMYTGLSSCRPTTYEALPTAGMPYMARTWDEFEKLYGFLLRSGAIKSMKDLWWDLRPSPGYGTLELRFCDEPATLRESLGIAAFVQLLGYWFKDHSEEWTTSQAPLKQWIFRENKWRAMRYGLDADIIVTRSGKTRALRKELLKWLDVLAPYAKRMEYQEYLEVVRDIINRGNSSMRQHNVFERSEDLMRVVEHNVKEFEGNMPLW